MSRVISLGFVFLHLLIASQAQGWVFGEVDSGYKQFNIEQSSGSKVAVSARTLTFALRLNPAPKAPGSGAGRAKSRGVSIANFSLGIVYDHSFLNEKDFPVPPEPGAYIRDLSIDLRISMPLYRTIPFLSFRHVIKSTMVANYSVLPYGETLSPTGEDVITGNYVSLGCQIPLKSFFHIVVGADYGMLTRQVEGKNLSITSVGGYAGAALGF